MQLSVHDPGLDTKLLLLLLLLQGRCSRPGTAYSSAADALLCRHFMHLRCTGQLLQLLAALQHVLLLTLIAAMQGGSIVPPQRQHQACHPGAHAAEGSLQPATTFERAATQAVRLCHACSVLLSATWTEAVAAIDCSMPLTWAVHAPAGHVSSMHAKGLSLSMHAGMAPGQDPSQAGSARLAWPWAQTGALAAAGASRWHLRVYESRHLPSGYPQLCCTATWMHAELFMTHSMTYA